MPCLFLSQLFGCQMHFVYRSKLVLCITKTAVFGSPFVACLGRYAKADSNIKYFGWGIKGGSRAGAEFKNSTAPGPRPLFLKFLDPPLGMTAQNPNKACLEALLQFSPERVYIHLCGNDILNIATTPKNFGLGPIH